MGQTLTRYTLILFAAALYGGPPMIGNDPYAPDTGMFEINIAAETEHRDDTTFIAPIFDINYGAIKNLQLTVEIAYINSPTQNDFDALELSLKYLFYQNDFFAVALNPAYKSFPIDTVFNNGEVYSFNLPMHFIVDKRLSIVTDIGFVTQKEGDDHFELGSYLRYEQPRYALFFELFAEESKAQNDIFTLFNLGFTYAFNDTYKLLLSCGRELHGEEKEAIIAYTGIQLNF